MPTTGRPLGLATIKQHLHAVSLDLPAGIDRDMCEALSVHLGQKKFMEPSTLHDVILDLDNFVGRQRDFLGESTVAYTNRCIDSLARMEHKLRMADTKQAVLAKVSAKNVMAKAAAKQANDAVIRKANLVSDRKASEAAARKALAKSSLQAIADALHVLINDVAHGHDDIDTFDSIRGLVHVMERMS